MARKFTQIPESTFKELQLDAGVLLKKFDPTGETPMENADIICATTGGINPSCVATYSDLGEDVDNCPANIQYTHGTFHNVSGNSLTGGKSRLHVA